MSRTRKRSPQQRANLRCCASCEWIYQQAEAPDPETGMDCPKCGFASYGARSVHGQRAYRYYITQQPWLTRSLRHTEMKLRSEHLAPHRLHLIEIGCLPRPVFSHINDE